MKILNQKPPDLVMESCQYHFKADLSNVVFTYGDTIYNPNNGFIDEFVLAHEEVHRLQQGDNPKAWWDKYYVDPKFRLEQELQAYRVQYRVVKAMIPERNQVAQRLFKMAHDLSSEIYGRAVTLTEALKLIKNGI